MKQPKGLKLFDRDTDDECDLALTIDRDDLGAHPGCAFIEVYGGSPGAFDADQLDKLASRCKSVAEYLRSLPKDITKKPKWEDL